MTHQQNIQIISENTDMEIHEVSELLHHQGYDEVTDDLVDDMIQMIIDIQEEVASDARWDDMMESQMEGRW